MPRGPLRGCRGAIGRRTESFGVIQLSRSATGVLKILRPRSTDDEAILAGDSLWGGRCGGPGYERSDGCHRRRLGEAAQKRSPR